MAIVLFDAQLYVARLAGVAGLKKVGTAADYASAAIDLKTPTPAAYVIPLRETPGRNTLENAVSQQNVTRFGVVLAVSNLRDAIGAKAGVDLRAIRIAVMTALLGWTPGPDYDVCTSGGGRLLQLSNAVLWWQDEYLTALFLRAT